MEKMAGEDAKFRKLFVPLPMHCGNCLIEPCAQWRLKPISNVSAGCGARHRGYKEELVFSYRMTFEV